MKALPIAASIALLFAAGPASSQSVQAPAISQLRCSDIANADAAHQAALVYYAAGYRDGVDYAKALNSTPANPTSSAISAMASTPVASAPAPSSGVAVPAITSTAVSSIASSAESASSPASTPGGLTLQAQDVVSDCKTSPNALLTDIVANRGGGTGFKGTPGGTSGGAAGGATPPNISASDGSPSSAAGTSPAASASAPTTGASSP